MTSHASRRRFLQGAGIAAAGSMMHPSIARALAIPANRRTGTIKDVEHIVILMQENRSFDHYYGTMRGVQGFGDPHPVPLSGGRKVWEQKDKEGKTILPFHLDTKATAALKVADLPHGWEDANGAARQGRWDGWIPWKSDLTMGHYRREDIPFQYALAEAFTICDAYHCSVHGQTNPNRLFIWAGGNDPRAVGGGPVVANSSGVALDVTFKITPEMLAAAKRHNIDLTKIDVSKYKNYGKGPRYTYKTYPERLEAAGISWKVYQDPKDNFMGLTNPAVAFQAYNDAKPGEPLHDKAMSRWTLDDLRADAMAGKLPQVVWIACSQSDSEHPEGSSPIEGANFTARVLDALTANPDVWSKTVLFLNFDENDGFYDHVTPPAPPGINPDGSRAGASTVDTTDDFHSDKLSYGLSVRVPMTVISPWSTGGWVNSQVFDHTSVIRFIETRFGVMEPNITPWRRAVCGDLTSAFDFSKHEAQRLALPDTSDAAKQVAAALQLPKPVAPVPGALPAQEPGTRPSRALPYGPAFDETVGNGSVQLRFGNVGKAGLVYQVHDLNDLDAMPRHYTVEPGKALAGDWAFAGQGYHLQVRGPNRWYREMKGSAQSHLAIATRVAGGKELVVEITNSGDAPVMLSCQDLLGGKQKQVEAAPGKTSWRVAIASTGQWYDIEIADRTGSGFLRRMSGRVETGRDSVSWPTPATLG
ncbi:phospholipase C [Sphingomonas laterariae]|uniref:phospholipase C n=1 Tax=Edaphosphingomonas laterariae TaxID=861865 RepID=A0A239CAW9_9SPHN|nr:phospholipase C, phosphocholine-specific [Sphingomonas laterariae]SNS17375.1 phospholipase C [Sphingomonas laterariae]